MPRANPAESLFAFGYSLDVGRICLKNNTSIILIIFRILFRIILKNLFYPGPSVLNMKTTKNKYYQKEIIKNRNH
jgi:hypothetical protein